MSRITIDLPSGFIFSTDIPIRISDINRGAHVSHVNLLGIIEEARAHLLHHLGYDALINLSGGIGLIVGDAGIIYKRQMSYGRPIRVEIAARDFTEKSFDMVYRLSDSANGEEVVRAKTGQLFFDYIKQIVIPVPEDFKRKILKYG